MNNKTYDVLKWVALVVLPALTTLWLTLANIWGFPYAEAIGATMAAITAFLGALLGVSSVQYNKKINAKNEDQENE